MHFWDIGAGELFLILLITFMVFGPKRLPEIGRGLGQAAREFKRYSSVLTKDFREEFDKEVNVDLGRKVERPAAKREETGEHEKPLMTEETTESQVTEAVKNP